VPKTAIVIPCYNEARRLDSAGYLEFLAKDPDAAFLFVDDGSTDETGRVLRELVARATGNASMLALERNSGKAEAVRRGILEALESRPRYVGFWDADLSTPLDVVPRFVEQLDAAPQMEMVMGARVQLLGRHIDRSLLRHYLGRLAATATSTTLGLRVYDTQCGAKMFRADTARVLFREPFQSRWIFDVEILARLIACHGGSSRLSASDVIWEYPLNRWRDVSGSKVRPRDYLRALFELRRIRRSYPRPG
jgi:glycosyltransferase involved in cell wall biosynthesis